MTTCRCGKRRNYLVYQSDYTARQKPLERAELVREGKHCSILTYSRMRCERRASSRGLKHLDLYDCSRRYVVEQAVKEAVAAGYDPEVIDLISLKPFDQSAISVRLSV